MMLTKEEALLAREALSTMIVKERLYEEYDPKLVQKLKDLRALLKKIEEFLKR